MTSRETAALARRDALPLQTRIGPIGTFNPETRTVDVTWTTGAKVRRRRYDWVRDRIVEYDETLIVSEKAINMERLKAGAPALDCHDGYSLRSVVGVVDRAWLEGQLGAATVRFPKPGLDAGADRIAGLVGDKIIRNVSCGYTPDKVRVVPATETEVEQWFVERWTPHEISFVPINADAAAQVRSVDSADGAALFPFEIVNRAEPAEEEVVMTTAVARPAGQSAPETRAEPVAQSATETVAVTSTATAQEAETLEQRVASFQRYARALGQSADETLAAMAAHRSAEAWRDHVLNTRADADQASHTSGHNIQIGRDEGDVKRRGMADALAAASSPSMRRELTGAAEQFRNMSPLRMAEEALAWRGVSTRNMSKMELAARALHSTSDFPLILADVANKRLKAAYGATPQTFRRWCQQGPDAPDFKNINVLSLGSAPLLAEIPEGDVYEYGTMGEGSEVYRVITYGKGLRVSRQMLVNDDLRAFDRIVSSFAISAARVENRLAYTQLTANAAMSDGVPLFHASHGNLTASGTVISDTSLGVGRTAMRVQTKLGSDPGLAVPAFLIVPSTLEQLAYKWTSSQYVPAKPGDTNEFRSGGRTALEPIVEPILDASSATAWYLAAENSELPGTVEYSYLQGSNGVYTESMLDFDSDGMKVKARLDVGFKAVDWIGLYKNVGA